MKTLNTNPTHLPSVPTTLVRKGFLFAILFTLSLIQGYCQDPIIGPTTKRILFLGNSITYQGTYIAYVETYLKSKYPALEAEFINVGLPSETVSGLSEAGHAQGKFPRPDLHERLDRVLETLQPDLVFATYGINDGIYQVYDNTRFQKFQEGIHWLHKKVSATGAALIHITPSIYDGKKDKGYGLVMDIYAAWLLSKAYTEGWTVIDQYSPMKEALTTQLKKDPNFTLTPDGVHPNAEGHWIMAQSLLQYLGESEVLGRKDILEAIKPYGQGKPFLKLIRERQTIARDAWLRETQHLRPGLAKGLPLDEAKEKIRTLDSQIRALQH